MCNCDLQKIVRTNARHILFFLVALWCIFLAAQKINLITSDLGRHITNGANILHNSGLLFSNFYSENFSDYLSINHHWGSGLLFFGIYHWFGFAGLSIFYLLISLITVYIFYRRAVFESGLWPTIGSSLFAIPLICSRTEVRPEMFSLLFCAIFYLILSRWDRNRKTWELFFLPCLIAIWINLHIYFVFGLWIVFIFWTKSFYQSFNSEKISLKRDFLNLSSVILLTILACFINPIGSSLVLYPLKIFHNYGYLLFENQSPWFLVNYGMFLPSFFVFFAIVLIILSCIFGILYLRRRLPNKPLMLITLTFLLMSCLAIRNFPFLGLFSMLYISQSYALLYDFFPLQKKTPLKRLLPIFFILLALIASAGYTLLRNPGINFGVGLMYNTNSSANFFRATQIKGPIFNNYDIGGYLIFHLFPNIRVFVDNRPESYPESFFKKLYIPMQEDEAVWKKAKEKFRFNAIYFQWHDYTTWGQKFIFARTQDPEWVPVYVDNYALILLKDNLENHSIIEKYKLPREIFRIH